MAFMVCLLLFSVGSVQSSIQMSVGFRVLAFSVSSVSIAFMVCTVQWVILCLYSSVSAVFRALAVHQESVMFMSCSESTLWMSSAPAQFLNYNILSTTEGHLRTKYNVKKSIKNPLIYQCTMTHFDTYLFSVGTHRGNLLVSSRSSAWDLNFCVHSIPLWEPRVEKPIMLRASVHRPVGGAP